MFFILQQQQQQSKKTTNTHLMIDNVLWWFIHPNCSTGINKLFWIRIWSVSGPALVCHPVIIRTEGVPLFPSSPERSIRSDKKSEAAAAEDRAEPELGLEPEPDPPPGLEPGPSASRNMTPRIGAAFVLLAALVATSSCGESKTKVKNKLWRSWKFVFLFDNLMRVEF